MTAIGAHRFWDAGDALAAARELTNPAFISLVELLPATPHGDRAASEVATPGLSENPLLAMPFAVKDNIDVAGSATTGACPTLTTPASRHAFAVEQLVAVGAIPIGKTNMDQFATGLRGTDRRTAPVLAWLPPTTSAAGAVRAAPSPSLRGSFPSRSARTAGSGRVPAAFNGIVGVKPTRGLVSVRGTLPACPSLDCVSILRRTVALARTVLKVIATFDPEDPWSRRYPVLRLRVSRVRCVWSAFPQGQSISTPNTDLRGRRHSRVSPVGCAWFLSMSPRCWRRRSCCTRRRSWQKDWRPSAISSSPTGRIWTPSSVPSFSVQQTSERTNCS